METVQLNKNELDPQSREFYCKAIEILDRNKLPFLVGGAYAYERYTGIARHTKDFDIFVRPEDCQRILDTFAAEGYKTELTFPHWLGKIYSGDGENFVDVIFSSGSGIARVDEAWFEHGVDDKVFDLPVKIIPAEEMIWSKSFVMERERYDGADLAHVLRACCEQFDWDRLMQRFDANWRVLLSHLILFGFAYPAERQKIPGRIMDQLIKKLQEEQNTPCASSDEKLCKGTLISREQYLIDVERGGYRDARLKPDGNMTPEELAIWKTDID